MTPKSIHKILIPKNIHFSENPKNIEIQNFEPQKMTRARVNPLGRQFAKLLHQISLSLQPLMKSVMPSKRKAVAISK